LLSVFFGSDDNILAQYKNEKIRLWSVETKEIIALPIVKKEKGILSIAISPNEKQILTGSGDKRVRLWDKATGAMIDEPLLGHKKGVTCLVFFSDSTAASGSRDKTIKIW
jgi:WD40 repeat protein